MHPNVCGVVYVCYQCVCEGVCVSVCERVCVCVCGCVGGSVCSPLWRSSNPSSTFEHDPIFYVLWPFVHWRLPQYCGSVARKQANRHTAVIFRLSVQIFNIQI